MSFLKSYFRYLNLVDSLRKVCQTAVFCCIIHNLVFTTNLKDENLGKFDVLLVI